MGFINHLIVLPLKIALVFLVLATIVTFVPGIPPDVKIESFSNPPSHKLEDFPTSFVLSKAELLFDAKAVRAPAGLESAALLGDVVYTGDGTGKIFKIKPNGESKVIAQYGYPCDYNWDFSTGTREDLGNCSWPLGMKFDKNGKNLFLVDAYGGLVKLDITTGISDVLVKRSEVIGGKNLYFPNDLDVSKEDGSIYWSVVSTNGDAKASYILSEMYGEPTGRLFKYDQKTKKNTVLVDKIAFANGVCLSENEDFVLVAEIVKSRILRYNLKGPNKGKTEVFVDRLPGNPDNIRSNGKGGFYAGAFARRDSNVDFIYVDRLAPYGLIRKFLLRSRFLLMHILDGALSAFPGSPYVQSAHDYVDRLGPLYDWSLIPQEGIVLELSAGGKIINVLRTDPKNNPHNIHTISQFTVGDKYAYISFPFTSKVFRVKKEDLPQ